MSEVFERLCPYYMMYGMTYEQYWYGDPWQMKPYREAHMLRNRHENEIAWVHGLYFCNALGVVLSNAFSKKGTPPKKYFEEPLDIFPKTEAEEKAAEEEKQNKLIAGLGAWKRMFESAKEQ